MQKTHLDLRSKNLGPNTSATAYKEPKKPPGLKNKNSPGYKTYWFLPDFFSYWQENARLFADLSSFNGHILAQYLSNFRGFLLFV
jgi:hypothetical protein